MSEPGGPRLSRENPWPGLVSFSEDDRAYFHGRDAEAGDLARLVRREPLAVLFGRSGLGKTSLLNAGLFPLLREENFIPVYVRLSFDTDAPLARQVLDALTGACRHGGIEAPAPVAGDSLWACFHRADAGFWNARNRPVVPVLVLDQFEEAFTVGQRTPESRERSAAFLGELGDLIENRMPDDVRRAIEADPVGADRYDPDRRGPKVVLSFREDFLAQMEGLKRQVPSLMRNRYRLQPMNGAQALEVVTASGGHLVGEDVARRIVGLAWRNTAEPPPDPAEYPDMEVDPALLSVICSELNVRRQRAGRDAIGADLLAGADREILADFYERSFEGLGPRVRAFVEDELITDRGYRDSFVLEDAVALPGLSQQAIDQLVDRRLLRVDDRLGLRRLELTHDVLTRVVRDSRDTRRAREAEAAAQAREQAALEQQRKNRRDALKVRIGVALTALLLGLAVWSWHRADVARKQAVAATLEALAARLEADGARDRANAARDEADTAKRMATQMDAGLAKALEALHAEATKAGQASTKAEKVKLVADRLIEQARATDLFINARSVPGPFLDRALLLGAEAIRTYPDRLEAQVDQLGRLLANPQLAALLRTGASQTAYAFSRDGRILAAGTEDGRVILWSTQTWQVVRDWKAHDWAVTALAFRSDASGLVTASQGVIVSWRLPAGGVEAEKIATLKDLYDAPVRLVSSPDGMAVAIQRGGGTVTLWRLADDSSASRQDIVYAPEGDHFRRDLHCLAFSSDGRTLTVATASGSVLTRDVAGPGPPVQEHRIDKALAFSPDCRIAAIDAGPEGGWHAVRLHRTDLGKDATRERLLNAPVRAVFSPDGKVLAVAMKDGGIDVLAAETGKQLRRLFTAEVPEALAFSPDGLLLARAFPGGSVTVDEWKSGYRRLRASVPGGIGELMFSPDGRLLVPSPPADKSGANNLALLLSLEGSDVLRQPSGGAPDLSGSVEFDMQGRKLLSAPRGGGIDLWDLAARNVRREPDAIKVEFSPDGTRIAIARRDGSVVIRPSDASGGVAETPLPHAGAAEVSELAFSMDNGTLAIGFDDGSFAIYSLAGSPRRILQTGPIHRKATKVAFNPAGMMVASAGADGRVVLWDAATGRELGPLEGKHSGAVLRLAFSPDGRRLASGGADRTVALHDVDRRTLAARLEPHEGPVETLIFIERGTVLLSGARNGSREVWDVARGRWLTTLHDPGGGSGSFAMSPERRQVAVLNEDGVVSLRDWSPATLVRDACRIANRNLTCIEWRQFMGDRPYRKTCGALPGPAGACR